MEKVFLSLVAAANPDERIISAVHAVIDFVYLASLLSHTTDTLDALAQALDTFHANKEVFIELHARKSDHFNIPKLHSLEHYRMMIERFGSADGYNTESPERLHIDFAKDAYQASNRKDYIYQMTVWLARQEAVQRYARYLMWVRNQTDLPPLIQTKDGLPPPKVSYKIAKFNPSDLAHTTATEIISQDGYKATEFLPAVSAYLRSQAVSVVPQPFDEFKLWRQVGFALPHIPQVGRRHDHDKIRATCAIVDGRSDSTGRRKPDKPAYLDFAFVRTGEQNAWTEGTSLEGESFILSPFFANCLQDFVSPKSS
jgi:hypothetical protein